MFLKTQFPFFFPCFLKTGEKNINYKFAIMHFLKCYLLKNLVHKYFIASHNTKFITHAKSTFQPQNLPNSRACASLWQACISSKVAFLDLTRSHLWTKPVSIRRAHTLWSLPPCSGWLELSPHMQACFNIRLSNASPVVSLCGPDPHTALLQWLLIATQEEAGMSVGPRATNGLDNARERGLAMWDDLGLKAEPSKQFYDITVCSADLL